MLVNITKASKLAGIGRDTLYKNYIDKGKISVSRDERNRPMIDTAEILRVFGRLHSVGTTLKENIQTIQENTLPNIHNTPDFSAQIAQLQAENALLKERLSETREQLREAKEREQWHREQTEGLIKSIESIKLLEAPKRKAGWLSRWF